MSKKVVTDQSTFSIQPKDIDATKHFYDAFGNMEKETSAHYIVKLCQEKGGWKPFTAEEIEAFYQKAGLHDGFWFNGLDEEGFVVLGKDNLYRVTDEFITRCYKSSPIRWYSNVSSRRPQIWIYPSAGVLFLTSYIFNPLQTDLRRLIIILMLTTLLKHYQVNLLLSLALAVIITLRYQNVFAVFALLPMAAITGLPTFASFIPQILLGTFLATFFLDLEFLLQAYVYEPATSFAENIRQLLAQKNIAGLLAFTTAHQDELQKPILRSSLFQVVLTILCAYLVFSKVTLLGTSFALGILLQSLYLGWQRKGKDWFWEIKVALPINIINVYFVALGLILIFLVFN